MNNRSCPKGRVVVAPRGSVGLRGAVCEALEARQMLSAAPGLGARTVVYTQPTFRYAAPVAAGAATPAASSPSGTTPQQMRHFYGLDALNFNGVAGDGTGQTIAIVDAYGAPNIVSDLHTFDLRFGLPDPPSFQQLSQSGGTSLPSPQTPGSQSWNVETSLDVEWAHVIAPKASLLLIECASANDSNLYAGVATAARQPGVVAVSMSFGSGESFGETSTDSTFLTPAGHAGVTFLGATGDQGSPGFYPAFSRNVVAVGGTSITLGPGGSYGSEGAWSGSGGGFSAGYESEPNYQRQVQNSGSRATPDVAIDADPNTGVPVYDSYDFPGSSWTQLGGTSLSTPMWAGIIALVDQARSTIGLSSLDGATGVLPKLYSLPAADFHDITSGSNGTYSATVGYDEVTGLGTPVGNLLVRDLAGLPAVNPPANDNVARAVAIAGDQATVSGTNAGATQEAGEPLNTSNSAGHTIWYSWLAPANAGQVTLSTNGSAVDTTLGVYTGSAASNLVQIAANDNDPSIPGATSSSLTFTATAGTTYLISIDSTTTSSPATGTTVLTLSAAPGNDNFASAATLGGTNASDSGFNFNATAEPGEPDPAGVSGAKSVWWNWTAPAGVASVTIDTRGSDFANTLGVYTGDSPAALNLVADAQSNASDTSAVTFAPIAFTTYHIMVNGVINSSSGDANQGHVTLNLVASSPSSVFGRYVFYNNSTFDGFDPAAGPSDDAAIAPDKQALLAGQPASFANYTSYSRGLNGLMIDLSDMPAHASLSAADFSFSVGNGGDPSTWAAAPVPLSITDRPGAGPFGADRIEIVWADNAIQNQWLQVIVKADAFTGLAAPDVFYFGNAIGESGNSTTDAIVDFADELGARNDPHSFLNPAPITDPYDFNRDGRVDAADQLIARNNATDATTALQLWTPPSASTPAVSTPQAAAAATAPPAPSNASTPLKRRHMTVTRRVVA